MPAMSSQARSPRQQSTAKVVSSPGPHSEEARSFTHDFPISPGTFLTSPWLSSKPKVLRSFLYS